MSARNRQALEYLQVRGYYTTGYSQIVQPERIFPATDYFRRYWVPLLKPGPAWLVVALRQHCWRNGERDWCVVGRETLAEECGVAVRTVDNYLDLPLVDWFVTGRRARYRQTADGSKQRDWSHYDLRLDEPLTPQHQAALAALARQMAAECQAGSPGARALEVAQRLLDLTPEQMWQRLDEGKAGPAPTGGPRGVLEIVVEAARGTGHEAHERGADAQSQELALNRACDALTTRLVQPEQVMIATQYFRRNWLPRLGAAGAWLVVHLRSRCYFNARQLEVRDRCVVAGLGELAAALGVSLSTVKTCLAEPAAAAFFERLATHRPARGKVKMEFRVEMIDPLTPADQERYAALIGEPAEQGEIAFPRTPSFGTGAARTTALAMTPEQEGQQPDFAGKPAEQQPESAGSPPPQQTDSAPSLDQQPGFADSPADQQPESAPIGGPANGQNLQGTRIPVNTTPADRTQQPQVLVRDGMEAVPIAAAVGTAADLLTALRIQEPSRSRILALDPPPETILAWAVEALTQDRIEHKAAFMVSVLQAGHAPPAELVELVRLTVGEWQEMAGAVRQARRDGWADLPAGLAGHFEALRQAGLAGMDPARWPFRLPDRPEEPARGEPDEGGGSPPAAAEAGLSEELPAARAQWAAALEALRWQMDPATFDAWLKNSEVIRVDGECWTVEVGSPAAADWLGHRLAGRIGRAVERVVGREIEIRFE